jgi:hypothetical protein
MLFAALLPFLTVTPDHFGFEFRGGLQDVRTGKRALHLLPQGGVSEVMHDLPAGTRSAAVWVRGARATVRLILRFQDEQGRPISSAENAAEAAEAWHRLRVQGRVPAARKVILAIQAVGEGHVSCDDAEAPIPDAGFEAGLASWRADPNGSGAAWVNDSTFVPWGFNYDRTIYEGRDLVLEEVPIEKIDRDFRAARRLGANSLRLFLQLSKFMPRYMEMDRSTLEFLDQVIECARKYDLKLDLTGLSHIIGIPEWFRGRPAQEIAQAEQHFWQAIAQRYAEEPAIFAYNLQNEPVVRAADDDLKVLGCFVMSEKRPFCYVNPHRLDPAAGREETARRWTAGTIRAIRAHDPNHLITIGMLSTAAPMMGFPNPAFNLRTVGPLLDYVSMHFYPNRPAADVLRANRDRLEMVLRYAGQFGKPVVMEEWYPMYPFGAKLPDGDWFPRVMDASRGNAAGWFTFYFSALKCDTCALPDYLKQFAAGSAEMQLFRPARAPATTTLAIDPEKLWRSKEEVERLLAEYQSLRRAGALPDFTWENKNR